MLHPHQPSWMVVNRLGWEVIQSFDGQRSVRDVATAVAARYNQDYESVYRDVITYLERVRQAGLLLDGEARQVSGHQGPALAHLHLHVTRNCNLRCIHCAIADGRRRADVLTTERIQQFIDELAAGGGRSIAITGGEPLLRRDGLRLVEYAAGKLQTTLSTNGTLITNRAARVLADTGVTVQVSLDGATAETHDRIRGQGTFEETWRGIERLQRHGIGERLAVCMTMMRPNIQEVSQLVELARARGVAGVRFFPLQRLGRADARWSELSPTPQVYAEAYEYLYQRRPEHGSSVVMHGGLHGFALGLRPGERWCALGHTLAIAADGSIYPCSLLMAPPFRLGNIRQMSLRQAIESPRLRVLCQACASREAVIEKCRSCTWRNFCQAGCAGVVHALRGTLWGTDDLCAVRQRLYRESLFGLAEKRIQWGQM